jgi:hypothetical protein
VEPHSWGDFTLILTLGSQIPCVIAWPIYYGIVLLMIILLGQVENSGNIPGVLKQHDSTAASTGKVSWSDVVRSNS